MGKLLKNTKKKTKKNPQQTETTKKLAIQYAFSDKMYFSLDILAKKEMFL